MDAKTKLLTLLSAHSDGLRMPEIIAALGVSQPTAWRRLRALESQGKVTSSGRARATRYYAVNALSAGDLRRKRMHELAARELVSHPELIKKVRRRLLKLREANPAGRPYHDHWAQLLDAEDLPRLFSEVQADTEFGQLLRKESPLTILVPAAERAKLFPKSVVDGVAA